MLMCWWSFNASALSVYSCESCATQDKFQGSEGTELCLMEEEFSDLKLG